MSPEPDLYAVLGVPEDASPAQIRHAYRERARRLHPDVGGEARPDDMALLNHAWFVLRDPDRRLDYGRPRPAGRATTNRPGRADLDTAGRDAADATLSGRAGRRLRYVVVLSALLLVIVVVATLLIGFTQGAGTAG
jgi:curved DNA-binding protein CbpA